MELRLAQALLRERVRALTLARRPAPSARAGTAEHVERIVRRRVEREARTVARALHVWQEDEARW